MGIQETLLNHKYSIIITLLTTLTIVAIFFLVPSFLTILAYFWPLLLSTALFLVAVVAFGKSSLPPGADSPGHKHAAEGLLEYVAGQPDHPVEGLNSWE